MSLAKTSQLIRLILLWESTYESTQDTVISDFARKSLSWRRIVGSGLGQIGPWIVFGGFCMFLWHLYTFQHCCFTSSMHSASTLMGPVNDLHWVACVSTELAMVAWNIWNQAGKIWQTTLSFISIYKQHWLETLKQLENSLKTLPRILGHSRSWNRGWKTQRAICRFHWNEDSIHVIFPVQEA